MADGGRKMLKAEILKAEKLADSEEQEQMAEASGGRGGKVER